MSLLDSVPVSASIGDLEQQVADLPTTATSSESWEQLRTWCVGRMQSSDCSAELRIRWAHLALLVIAKQGRAGAGEAQKTVAATARVRAYMIREFGVSTTDEARQPKRLCAYVLQNIGRPIDEVARAAAEWRSLPSEHTLSLRRLKNMLTPLVEIEVLLHPDEAIRHEIGPWLALRVALP